MSATFNVDELTNAQLDRLQERLTARVEQKRAERDAAERERKERYDPRPLRPHIGNGGQAFGNSLARNNWDKDCLAALGRQTVRFAVAPNCSVLCRDGSRLLTGQELKPHEHLNALQGDQMIQVQRLVEGGLILYKETTP
jgi:hypothetical protein